MELVPRLKGPRAKRVQYMYDDDNMPHNLQDFRLVVMSKNCVVVFMTHDALTVRDSFTTFKNRYDMCCLKGAM
jgi:hypothetical protein